MSRYSDSESQDSDDGIRYKTDTTRYKSQNLSPSKRRSRSRSPHDTRIGPQLPPAKQEKSACIGPQLPPQQTPSNSSKSGEKTDSSYFGPRLPPHLKSKAIGPQLPPHLREKLQQTPQEDESDEDDYGPLPAGVSTTSRAQLALEERALLLKMDQLEPDKDKQPVREEWMLELPTVKAANFGLGPRQFRSKVGPDMSDRSSWTDTPEEKKKPKKQKVDLKKEAEDKEIRKRDEEQEKMSKKSKRKSETLLEIHQAKMKEKKKDEGPSERRPFSRDLDLQVNRFDEAQKKAVLKKAQLLDDRFSRGQSKFL